MSLLRRRPPWSPSEIPDMSFDGPTDFVDIGFLGGDDHRAAFIAIFKRVLLDNQAVLAGTTLSAVKARRPVGLAAILNTRLLTVDADQLAGQLYDSQNDEVRLRLRTQGGEAELGI
jgi:hypothetical protein